jgi:OOP family OmpA-OmpF porin
LVNAGCNRDGSVTPNSVTLPKGTLIVEGDPWSGYMPFRWDEFLKGSGYQYSYREQLDQAVRARNMTEGKINFMVTTMDQYLKNKPAGKIVGMIDMSLGADALVLNTPMHPYLKSIDDLPRLVSELKKQGRKPKIAYTGNSPSEWLFVKLSNTRSDELKRSDFEEIPVDVSTTALKMLQDKKVDLAVLWEPDVSSARQEGYTVALSSKDVPNSVLDVLVASDYIIQNDPAAVQAVVDAFYAFRDHAVQDHGWFVKLIAKDGNLDEPSTETLLQGVYFYDAKAADEYMNRRVYPLDETKAFEALQSIGGIVSLSDPTVQPVGSMIDGRFVAKAAAARR